MSEIVEKPWGKYEDLYRAHNIVLKKITVNPKSRLSLQFHYKRNEFWVVTKGVCLCEVYDNIHRLYNVYRLYEGDAIKIEIGTAHRLINDGLDPCEITELQYGECEEHDIVRHEDDYNRIIPF